MRKREETQLPDPNYFKRQSSIHPWMRATIVDWLVDVHKALKLHTDTLFTAVTLIDLVLSRCDIPQSKFQLLSGAALLLAAKGEELHPPGLAEFSKVTSNAFNVEDFAQIESEISEVLEYQIHPVQSCHFLKRFLQMIDTFTKLTMIAHYINETALLDNSMIGVRPSIQAAAAVAVALTICKGESKVITNTGYSTVQLQPMANKLLASVQQFGNSQFKAIRRKYSRRALAAVSELVFPESINLE
jgi:transcription initiation factor TFIIIB Brf1 subunit/transcription initiation factor TFIIB